MGARQCIAKYFPSAFMIFLFVILFNSSNYSPLFAQDSEWVSFTLNRVNLRQDPTIRGELIVTLDEGTPVHVFDEFVNTVNEGWLHLYFSTGDSGWVRNDFIAPRAALDRHPGIQDFLLGAGGSFNASEVEQETQTGPEFTREPEPAVIILGDTNGQDGSILSVLSWIYFVLSLFVIAFLWHKGRKPDVESGLLSGTDKLQNEFKLLKNANQDLMKQLQFAEEKYAKQELEIAEKKKNIQTQNEMHRQEITDLKNKFYLLEKTHNNRSDELNQKDDYVEKLEQDRKKLLKEIEAANQKLIQSSENVKAQVIKSTMAGRAHEESLQLKENKIRQLLDDLETANNVKSQLEKNHEEKTAGLRSENNSFKEKLSELEKTLSEKEKEIDNKIAQARIDSKKWFESQISDRVNEEKTTLERRFAQDIEELKNSMQVNKNMLIENNKNIKTRLSETELKYNEEKKARLEIESKSVSVAWSDASKSSALKDLQKEYNALLKEYNTSRKKLSDDTIKTQPVAEEQPKEEIVTKTESESEKFEPRKKEPFTAKFEPHLSGNTLDGNKYDEYVRGFFKKISKL
ncbi:SH3 domain-containing protein [candidate division KSB1 bacterium]|nr:SH3 domain-containing protein [candidate division KSB1 bacterium]